MHSRQNQYSKAMLLSTATCYSVESSRISEIYTKCSMREDHNITVIEEDILRANYRNIMTRRTWKNELLAVGQRLVDDRLGLQKDSGIDEWPGNSDCTVRHSGPELDEPKKALLSCSGKHVTVNIIYSKKKYSFTNINGAVAVFIGRRLGCDVRLKQKRPPWKCSRLHAVLFILESGQAIIADVGSYHGIRVGHSNIKHKTVHSSVPGERRLLTYQEGNRIMLVMGTEKLLITIEPNTDAVPKPKKKSFMDFAGAKGTTFLRFIEDLKFMTFKTCVYSNAADAE